MIMKRLIFLLFLGSSILQLRAQQVVDVYLLGGQSNMTGQGLVFNLPAGFLIDKEVMIYYSRFTNQGEGSMQWNPLCPAAERKVRFGVELTLGGGLHKAYPDRKIALIKHALSGSKEQKCGDMKYGRNFYDYEDGTLVFLAPEQIVRIENRLPHQLKGWTLMFHPDLLRGTALG